MRTHRGGWPGRVAWPLFVLALISAGCAGPGTVAPAPGSPDRATVERLLDTVRVVPTRPRPGGYERGCSGQQGCVFGPAWSDDHDGAGGHDGCDTRNDVLAAQLTAPSFRPGTRDCVVVSGTLVDPYSGDTMAFAKAEAGEVQIDHVYPLAAAWDMGAADWSPARRVLFANDLDTNLLATSGRVNQDKGDATPGSWMPPARSHHCFYAAKYLTVATTYDLPITVADERVLREVAATCP